MTSPPKQPRLRASRAYAAVVLAMALLGLTGCEPVDDDGADAGVFDGRALGERCENGIDDDGDGFVDCGDSDCESTVVCRSAGEHCSNLVDDDGDGDTDCDDSDCAFTRVCFDRGEDCDNRRDDDGDGDADCEDDDCAGTRFCVQAPEICDNGADDDADGDVDCDDPDCELQPGCLPDYEVCDNGSDDDADGDVDCDDSDCANTTLCSDPAEICTNNSDDDGDGQVDCDDDDCAQTTICVEETCADLRDDDADGRPDCGDLECLATMACPWSTAAALRANAPWPMKGGWAHRRGQSVHAGPTTDNLRWTFDSGIQVLSSPIVDADGTVYFGAKDTLHAVAPDGTEKWTASLPLDRRDSVTLASDGSVRVLSSTVGSAYVSSLAPGDGSTLWEYAAGNAVISSPTPGPFGASYFADAGGTLVKIDAMGQNVVSRPISGSPTVHSGVAMADDGTMCLGLINGGEVRAYTRELNRVWIASVDDHVRESPVVAADGTVYVTTDAGSLFALEPDGTQRWSYTTNSISATGPAVALDGTVMYGTRDGTLRGVNPTDGTEAWTLPGLGILGEAPIVDSSGRIYFATDANEVYAYDSNQSQLWTYTTAADVASAPALGANGVLYVTTLDGKLLAFGP